MAAAAVLTDTAVCDRVLCGDFGKGYDGERSSHSAEPNAKAPEPEMPFAEEAWPELNRPG